MTDRELLQQALDVMEDLGIKEAEIVSQAIRTRLAQPEDKPNKLINVNGVLEQAGYVKKKEWVGLTDEEIYEIYEMAEEKIIKHWESGGTTMMFPLTVYKAFEAKLKEKNSE